jgi:ribosomal subunit interface protein
MISRIEISGIHAEINSDLHKYTIKKLGKLDKYMSRHVRESAHLEVMLKESKIKTKKQYTCEVVLHLPKDTITLKETTLNMFAAVDIVETKLKNSLKKYKDKHDTRHVTRRLLTKIRSRRAV